MTRKEQIIEMAHRIAGPGITIRTHEVDEILEAGWDGIANGSVVYQDRLTGPTKVYTKIDADTVQINDGPTVTLTGEQKEKMVDTYAMISIIGAKA